MPNALIVIFLVSICLLIAGLAEQVLFRRSLRSIPHRIHVNGIRGKSTVTRLIAAGIRGNHRRVIAKTTGTEPRVILEDGSEEEIRRFGPANIREQVKIARMVAKRRPEFFVVECMAVRPDLQWVHEHKMVQSQVGVITNVRMDHMDVMGETLEEIAESLSNTIPIRGSLVTIPGPGLEVLNRRAAIQGTRVVTVDSSALPREMLQRFPYVIFPDNVSLALKVCELLGLDRDQALAGMVAATPDPGALQVFDISLNQKQVRFANAFAANEPHSTLMIWERLQITPSSDRPVLVILNTRADRITRSAQFAELLAGGLAFDTAILTGDNTRLALRTARARGVAKNRLVNLGTAKLSTVIDTVLSLTPKASTVIGIGNIGGIGHDIVDYFAKLNQGFRC